MKKRIEKPKAKPVKPEPAKREPAPKAPAKAASPQDPLHDLLRGAHAHKICR
jgi:hypothetical protein